MQILFIAAIVVTTLILIAFFGLCSGITAMGIASYEAYGPGDYALEKQDRRRTAILIISVWSIFILLSYLNYFCFIPWLASLVH